MKQPHIRRLLSLPSRSFFLFGPRGVGKSTWLRHALHDALYLDLLDSALHIELSREPCQLEAMAGPLPEDGWIVLDEIQKVPILLDEVHRLMETKRWRFALCGSSARKLKQKGVNLLAGRAITRHLETFSWAELGGLFDLKFHLQWGLLPAVQFDPDNAADILQAYAHTYIQEEVRQEAVVRNVPPFLRFLQIAGMLNGQVINKQNIAREASVPRSSVDIYFAVLEDTLLGQFLPAYRPNVKVREQAHPKFYWFDCGVARAAAGLLRDPPDGLWKGSSLETLIYHELRVHNHTQNKHRPIGFYRTASGTEIDFVIETRKRSGHSPARVVCIEVKLSDKWKRVWERPMLSLHDSKQLIVEKMYGIYTGQRKYDYDGVHVLPVQTFLEQLHSGKVF